MDKRISQRSSKLLAAAVASVGLAGIGTSQSHGGVVVDLRATYILNSPAYNAGIPFADPKSVHANVGDTILMNVVVRISGTNGVQTVGDFDGGGVANDTRNDDTLQAMVGAFQSVGTLGGNFNNTVHGMQVSPWGASGSTNGTLNDFDSDGDLDLGALGTDPTNMWASRAAGPNATTISVSGNAMTGFVTKFGVSAGSSFTQDTGGQLGGQPPTVDQIIDTNTADILMGELAWVVTNANGAANVNFVPRSNAEAAQLWFEDGITTGKNAGNAPFAVGAPVNVVVPEPATLGLLGLASLGLLARRRQSR